MTRTDVTDDVAACFVGFDLGTTTFKAVVVDGRGRDLASARVPSPWRQVDGSQVLVGTDVLDTVQALAADLGPALVGRPIGGVSFASIAEAGFLVDPGTGRTESDALAWFDARGADEARAARLVLGDGFEGRTGVALNDRVSIGKVRWLRSRQDDDGAKAWCSLAEWVAWQVGGELAAELSLATRTGLFDVATRAWWPEALEFAGLTASVMPPLRPAGTPLGRASEWLGPLAGAVLSVAGHDHVAAAVGAGATTADVVFDSLGTGEALVRPTPRGDSPADVAGSVAEALARGPHVVPDTDYAFAALGSGRVLSAVRDGFGLDVADLHATYARAATVAERDVRPLVSAAFDGTEVDADTLRGVDPALAWRAAVEHVTDRCVDALHRMDVRFGPHREVHAAGGWLRIPMVHGLRVARVPHYVALADREVGALGAATVAAWSVDVLPRGEAWPATPAVLDQTA